MGFRGRHAVFCDAKCPSYFSSSSSTTPSTTTTSTTDAHEEENEIVSYENLTKDGRRKLKLERRRERTRRRLEKARRKSGEQDESQEEEYKLGPLGNFIKELIVANTFVD